MALKMLLVAPLLAQVILLAVFLYATEVKSVEKL
jgi:hypothetical protein